MKASRANAALLERFRLNSSKVVSTTIGKLVSKDDYRTTPRGYLVRREPKRDKSISARQWKKRIKYERRWYSNNVNWFGPKEAAKVGDRRIPVMVGE